MLKNTFFYLHVFTVGVIASLLPSQSDKKDESLNIVFFSFHKVLTNTPSPFTIFVKDKFQNVYKIFKD